MDVASGPPAAYESGADRLRRLERTDELARLLLTSARNPDTRHDHWVDLVVWAIERHLILEVVELISLASLAVEFWRLAHSHISDSEDLCRIEGDSLYLGNSREPISLTATLAAGDGVAGAAHLRDFVILLTLLVDMTYESHPLASVESALPERYVISTELADAVAIITRWHLVNVADKLPAAEFILRIIPAAHLDRIFRRAETDGFIRVLYLAVAPTPRLMAAAPEKLWKLGPAPESGDPEEVLREAEAELARCARETAAGREIYRYYSERIEAWLAWRRGAPRRVPEAPSHVHRPYATARNSQRSLVARCYALADAGTSRADFSRGVEPGINIFGIGRYLHNYAADFSIYPRVYSLDAFVHVAHYLSKSVGIDVEGDRLYILNDGPRPLAATMRSELGPYMIIIAAGGAARGRPATMRAIAPHVKAVEPWLAALILTGNLTWSGGRRDVADEVADFFASRMRPDAFAAVMTQAVADEIARPQAWPLHGDELIFELARRCGPATERAVAEWNVAPPFDPRRAAPSPPADEPIR